MKFIVVQCYEVEISNTELATVQAQRQDNPLRMSMTEMVNRKVKALHRDQIPGVQMLSSMISAVA